MRTMRERPVPASAADPVAAAGFGGEAGGAAAFAPLRVLHCPSMVGGNPQQLARAERELGLRSHAVSLQPSAFAYPSDEVLCGPSAGTARIHLARLQLLARALRYDVVHLNFGQTILPEPFWRAAPAHQRGGGLLKGAVRGALGQLAYRDLQLLRAAGKGIFVTFQGDDARQGDFCRENFEITFADEVEADYYPPGSDQLKRERIRHFARYADGIYSVNPDLLHVLPPSARFVPYAHVDMRHWQPAPRGAAGGPPVIVHAPSHRAVKGTRFLLEAVERLRAEGVAFEFRMIEGLTNEAARREYERADLLVDQLLAGWYGGLAVELMALGKPAMAYIREDDLRFLPAGMRADLPLIQATPASIYDVLRSWLARPREEWDAAGRRARAYVERWHDPLRIARFLAGEYTRATSARRGGRRAHAEPAER